MRHSILRQPALCALLALLCWGSSATAGEAPARFVTLTGASATLLDYTGQGKWLVVKIWASTCHVCNDTAHEMVALSTQRRGDIQVLGIAVDGLPNRDGVVDFIERHGLNYPTLLDDGRGAATAYRRGVQREWGGWTPTYLVYAPDGELVAQNVGAVTAADVMRFVDGYAGQPGS